MNRIDADQAITPFRVAGETAPGPGAPAFEAGGRAFDVGLNLRVPQSFTFFVKGAGFYSSLEFT